MIIIATLNFPADSAQQVAERFAAALPPPPFVSLAGPYVRGDIEDGMRTMAIFEFPPSDARVVAAYLDRRYAAFADVPGLTISLEEWFGADAALQLFRETGSIEEALAMASLNI